MDAGANLGLIVLAEHIQTYPDNFTKFGVIGTRDAGLGPREQDLAGDGGRRPSRLAVPLAPAARRPGREPHQARVASRRGAPFEYVFYIDLDGSVEDEHVAAALDEVKVHTSMLKVLGSYPASKGPV